MIDPVVDMKSFKKDVEDGMSALDLKEKYVLTSRQYRKLTENIERKKPSKRKKSKMKRKIHTFFDVPYISIDANTKKYAIRKDNTYYGLYDDLDSGNPSDALDINDPSNGGLGDYVICYFEIREALENILRTHKEFIKKVEK